MPHKPITNQNFILPNKFRIERTNERDQGEKKWSIILSAKGNPDTWTPSKKRKATPDWALRKITKAAWPIYRKQRFRS